MTESTPPATGWTDATPTGWLSVRVDFLATEREMATAAKWMSTFEGLAGQHSVGSGPAVEAFLGQVSDALLAVLRAWDDAPPCSQVQVQVGFMSAHECLAAGHALKGIAATGEDGIGKAFSRHLGDVIWERGQDLLDEDERGMWRLLQALGDDDALAAWLTPETGAGEVE